MVSLTLHPLYPWGNCPQYQLNRRLDGPVLAWKHCRSEKSRDPARNLTSITDSCIWATACQTQLLHYHSYPFRVCLILHICHHLYFTAATSHLGRNGSRNNVKVETMTKLILNCTLQFCMLFSYKLCACHMTGCSYTQALFHSGCAACTTVP